MSDLMFLATSPVKDVVEDDYLSVARSEMISRLSSRLYGSGSYEAIVANGKPRLVTVRDLLKVTHADRTSVSRIATRPPNVTLAMTVHEASLLMVRNRVRMLPVLEDTSVVGVVRQTKILEKMTACGDLKEFLVEELMVKKMFLATLDSSAAYVRSMMIGRGISHAPIVDSEGRLKGIIRAKDLVWYFVKPRESVRIGEKGRERMRHWEVRIAGLVDKDPLTTTPRTSMLDVVREMDDRKEGYCLVVQRNEPVGIITPREAISLLTAFRPTVEVPIYIVGFRGQEEELLQSSKAKIERVARKALRMHPDIHEIVVHGRTSSSEGERTRFAVRARAYSPSKLWTVSAAGWSLLTVIDEICEKLDRRFRRN